ncbi:MAG: asparagine synthase-related protein [candidate division WOR-3 bacterium]
MVDFGGNPSQEQVRVEANPMVFREVIAESLNGATKAGLLLSAGYDSRAILATLRGLGAEVRTVTCGLPSSVDVRIARQLTEAVGGRHAVWPSFPEDAEDLSETAKELTRVAEGGVGVHYVGRYWVVKQQRGKVPVVFSGQGEMVRRTPPDSEYLSQAAFNGLRELHGGGPRAKGQAQRGEGQASGPSALCPLPSAEPFHFFDLAAIAALDGGEGKEETEETLRSYRGSTLGETVTAFLLEEGHRKVFANLGAAESTQVPVAMPFLDDRVMALVLNRPFSVTQLVDWQPSLRATMAGRRLYHRIIAENDPRLLQVPLDRGYPPAWDVGWRGWLMTGWWQVRSRTRRRMPPSSDDRLPFKTFLKNLLSEQRTRNRPFYNHGKLQQALQQFPHWPSRVEFELSKVATVELWLREFME